MSDRNLHVLLVEDNPADVALTQEAMRAGRVLHEMSVCVDGIEALEFLRREGPHANAKRPDLILLDINMPRMDGRELLAAIKGDAELRAIPVVVLTTSRADEEIARAYRLQANAYVTKPVDFDRFLEVIQAIEEFWLNIVVLPAEEAEAPRRR